MFRGATRLPFWSEPPPIGVVFVRNAKEIIAAKVKNTVDVSYIDGCAGRLETRRRLWFIDYRGLRQFVFNRAQQFYDSLLFTDDSSHTDFPRL